ncbi:hypothetical protein [Niastella populi]|uniref:Uncharacterized protein n=1 Tax=Niastella populi TaxID=550983 RepID=A0A1V9FEH0_9BACT|nr:hypothetical protein [Niastella populi]OQP56753.1 hypothetical protein A4R26_25210 [Niastella populi]
MVTKLAQFHPDKIFPEFSAKFQPTWDSIYNDNLQGKEPVVEKTRAHAIFQLGMPTAKLFEVIDLDQELN